MCVQVGIDIITIVNMNTIQQVVHEYEVYYRMC